jgi:hypothetical protein
MTSNDNPVPALFVLPDPVRKDPLPTTAAAFLGLLNAARAFGERQTDTTFEQLAAAVATARLVKLY